MDMTNNSSDIPDALLSRAGLKPTVKPQSYMDAMKEGNALLDKDIPTPTPVKKKTSSKKPELVSSKIFERAYDLVLKSYPVWKQKEIALLSSSKDYDHCRLTAFAKEVSAKANELLDL